MPAHGCSVSAGVFTISVSANNVNLKTVCGSPTVAGTFTVTINSGVVLGSTTTAPAVTCTAFPAGSVVKVVNNGSIYGSSGAPGAGSTFTGGSGGTGGDAISTSENLTIDNTNGEIFGGGGGGGGGGGNSFVSGGNGGNGQGTPSNTAGPGAGSAGTPGAADGGSGGSWGLFGDFGGDSFSPGGGGGTSGYAVRKNGKTITWLGGNNSLRVRGNVA